MCPKARRPRDHRRAARARRAPMGRRADPGLPDAGPASRQSSRPSALRAVAVPAAAVAAVHRAGAEALSRKLVSSGSPFETVAGYSRAVVQGDWCFVAGTTGYDYATMQMPPDVRDQARNALNTIAAALAEGGFSLRDVVRATYYITPDVDWSVVSPVFGELFRDVRPAATCIATGLVAPEMKIEIEVTAFRG